MHFSLREFIFSAPNASYPYQRLVEVCLSDVLLNNWRSVGTFKITEGSTSGVK